MLNLMFTTVFTQREIQCLCIKFDLRIYNTYTNIVIEMDYFIASLNRWLSAAIALSWFCVTTIRPWRKPFFRGSELFLSRIRLDATQRIAGL